MDAVIMQLNERDTWTRGEANNVMVPAKDILRNLPAKMQSIIINIGQFLFIIDILLLNFCNVTVFLSFKHN